jgi:hypothetical protein
MLDFGDDVLASSPAALCRASAQLPQRECHEQASGGVREMVLALIAFAQEPQVLFSAREMVVGSPPHPIVVGMLRRPVAHHAGDGLEGAGEGVSRAAISPRALPLLRRLFGFRRHEVLGYHSLPSRGYLARKREIAREPLHE